MKHVSLRLLALALCCLLAQTSFSTDLSSARFQLVQHDYFRCEGTDVMAFSDFYPEGHQGGISLLMNGHRIATNGDLRLEPTPGQWQPVPKQLARLVSDSAIVTTLCFPDSSRHLTGFNPMVYPDMQLTYHVRLAPEGKGFRVMVDLDQPIPDALVGRVGFNLEIFPGEAFGEPWIMDSQSGIYPRQPNGPVLQQASYLDASVGDYTPAGKPTISMERMRSNGYSPLAADEVIAAPYAVGHQFVSCPNNPSKCFKVTSLSEELALYDGRMNHNNGWFVLRSTIAAGKTSGAVDWYIEPCVTEGWRYQPVVQVNQVGYLPHQTKVAVVERDLRDNDLLPARLIRFTSDGEEEVGPVNVKKWEGTFLRYRYDLIDFSSISQPGLYQMEYGNSRSAIFRIDENVLDRGVWQPVIEYFLPVQMCHMRVNEKYKVWHDMCHMDDAQMAQPGNLFDGYDQAPDNHTHHHAGDFVEGLNCGGWHDAGDFDLRIESQAGECYILAMAYEQFHPEIDATTIDQAQHLVEIHQPDGKNDVLQQIEHGALSVVGGYKALGRLYRGIICSHLRQYVLLGDAAAMTDGVPGNDDDRWVYTEVNPGRELSTAAALAATSRALKQYNPDLSQECLTISRALFDSLQTAPNASRQRLQAAAELYITTREQTYLNHILAAETDMLAPERSIFNDQLSFPTTNLATLARVAPLLSGSKDKRVKRWLKTYRNALETYSQHLQSVMQETPYGVPYRPSIWGAGWDIQRFGYENYFLAVAYPDLFPKEPICNALSFILGCHPGLNRSSFAGGVGTESTIVGYGLNRAEWSYIPGGVVSGTALIRPDFPELLVFPYLWQQTEYVLGGGSSHYMFLVLAVQALLQ